MKPKSGWRRKRKSTFWRSEYDMFRALEIAMEIFVQPDILEWDKTRDEGDGIVEQLWAKGEDLA